MLGAYLATMLAVPGVAETVSIEHIKALNPNGIVPTGPDLPSLAPFSLKAKH